MAPHVIALRTDAGRGHRERGYRADIDGLRALSIVLVVAFHFGLPGGRGTVGGGYIGVDLFFVISGFLIAAIFERTPVLSPAIVVAFYVRRIKRLAPAFVVVAAVTLVVATWLLLPDEYQAFLRSVRDSLSFTANHHFARATAGYFAGDAAQMPWLHTWSLSIEWQFYAVFPLVILGMRRFASGRARRLAWVALTLVALAASVALVARSPADAYFSTAARFFEFLLGAIATRVPASVGTKAASRWFPTIGVALLVLIALRYDADTPFPGLAALPVCLIACGLLVTGRHASPLSRPAFAWIGRRSYSIYLWHWPLVAFSATLQHVPTAVERVVWVVGLVAVADLTYRFVERPGLRLAWRPRETIIAGCIVPFFVMATAASIVRHADGWPGRLGPAIDRAHRNVVRYESHQADHCHDAAADVDLASCAIGDVAATTQALLIGDSHARHFRAFVDVLASRAHVKVVGLTNSECTPFESSAADAPLRSRAACVAAAARDAALIRSGRFRTVIVAERWAGYSTAARAGLDDTLATIVAAGSTPVIFAPVAEDGTETRLCFYRRLRFASATTASCDIRQDNDFARTEKRDVASLIAAMRRRYPALIVIDPQRVQCTAGVCETSIDGTPIYADEHHLNAFGSTRLGEAWVARFGDPLTKPGSR